MMSIWGSGHVNSATREALVGLANQFDYALTASAQPDNTVLSPFLRHWKTASDPTLDPCWIPLHGIWCENGSVVMINFNQISGASGSLNDTAFSALNSLAIFFLSAGLFQGAFPFKWCSWASSMSLSHCIIQTNGFTSMPNCWDELPNLQVLHIVNNPIDGFFPTSIVNASGLVYLALNNLGLIGSIPSELGILPSNLQLLSLNNNQLNGTIPNFNGNSKLISIDLGTNQLGGTDISSYFDNLLAGPTTIILRNNLFSSPMPRLINSQTNLTTIDFSFNLFNGTIPASWSANLMGQLKVLGLNNNQLTNPSTGVPNTPYSILSKLSNKILTLDLSNNRIQLYPALSTGSSLFYWINAICSPSIISIDLSNNLIGGIQYAGGPTQISTNCPSLQTVLAANNQITHLPNDMWRANLVTVWDFSNNNISGIDNGTPGSGVALLQSGIPSAQSPPNNLLRLLLAGNPNLHSVNGLLPSFTQLKMGSANKVGSLPFICYNLIGTSAYPKLQVTLDPQYNDYSTCECDIGTYGTPPNCLLIPDKSILNIQNSSLIPINYLNTNQYSLFHNSINLKLRNNNHTVTNNCLSIHDSEYGSKRYITGINTYWHINLSNDNTSAIYILLFINRDIFIGLTNEIIMYSGESDLLGEKIFNIRGDNIIELIEGGKYFQQYITQGVNEFNQNLTNQYFSNTALFSILVVNCKANLQFISRDTSGQHFIMEYYPSSICPNNYYKNNNNICIKTPLCNYNDYSYYINNVDENTLTRIINYQLSIVTPCIASIELGGIQLPDAVKISLDYLPFNSKYSYLFLVLACFCVIIILLPFLIAILTISFYSSNSILGIESVNNGFNKCYLYFIHHYRFAYHIFSSWPIFRLSGSIPLFVHSLGLLLGLAIIFINIDQLNELKCELRIILLLAAYLLQQFNLLASNLLAIKQQSGLLYSKIQLKRRINITILTILLINFIFIMLALKYNSPYYSESYIETVGGAIISGSICIYGSNNIYLLILLIFNGTWSIINTFSCLYRWLSYYLLTYPNNNNNNNNNNTQSTIEFDICNSSPIYSHRKHRLFLLQNASLMYSSISCIISYGIILIYSYTTNNGLNNLNIVFLQNITIILGSLISYCGLYGPSTIAFIALKWRIYKRNCNNNHVSYDNNKYYKPSFVGELSYDIQDESIYCGSQNKLHTRIEFNSISDNQSTTNSTKDNNSVTNIGREHSINLDQDIRIAHQILDHWIIHDNNNIDHETNNLLNNNPNSNNSNNDSNSIDSSSLNTLYGVLNDEVATIEFIQSARESMEEENILFLLEIKNLFKLLHLNNAYRIVNKENHIISKESNFLNYNNFSQITTITDQSKSTHRNLTNNNQHNNNNNSGSIPCVHTIANHRVNVESNIDNNNIIVQDQGISLYDILIRIHGLYMEYIASNSTQEIHLSSKQREQVKKDIKSLFIKSIRYSIQQEAVNKSEQVTNNQILSNNSNQNIAKRLNSNPNPEQDEEEAKHESNEIEENNNTFQTNTPATQSMQTQTAQKNLNRISDYPISQSIINNSNLSHINKNQSKNNNKINSSLNHNPHSIDLSALIFSRKLDFQLIFTAYTNNAKLETIHPNISNINNNVDYWHLDGTSYNNNADELLLGYKYFLKSRNIAAPAYLRIYSKTIFYAISHCILIQLQSYAWNRFLSSKFANRANQLIEWCSAFDQLNINERLAVIKRFQKQCNFKQINTNKTRRRATATATAAAAVAATTTTTETTPISQCNQTQ